MSNYVRESVLVDPMPNGPFIRLYNYRGKIFDAGLCAAYFGNAKKSRKMFIFELHRENDIPLNETLSISHDFYDNPENMQYVMKRSRVVYPDVERCPKCGSMYVGHNPKAWFCHSKCFACNFKWQ